MSQISGISRYTPTLFFSRFPVPPRFSLRSRPPAPLFCASLILDTVVLPEFSSCVSVPRFDYVIYFPSLFFVDLLLDASCPPLFRINCLHIWHMSSFPFLLPFFKSISSFLRDFCHRYVPLFSPVGAFAAELFAGFNFEVLESCHEAPPIRFAPEKLAVCSSSGCLAEYVAFCTILFLSHGVPFILPLSSRVEVKAVFFRNSAV